MLSGNSDHMIHLCYNYCPYIFHLMFPACIIIWKCIRPTLGYGNCTRAVVVGILHVTDSPKLCHKMDNFRLPSRPHDWTQVITQCRVKYIIMWFALRYSLKGKKCGLGQKVGEGKREKGKKTRRKK